MGNREGCVEGFGMKGLGRGSGGGTYRSTISPFSFCIVERVD